MTDDTFLVGLEDATNVLALADIMLLSQRWKTILGEKELSIVVWIVQELLNNAVRHGAATESATVTLDGPRRAILLAVPGAKFDSVSLGARRQPHHGLGKSHFLLTHAQAVWSWRFASGRNRIKIVLPMRST